MRTDENRVGQVALAGIRVLSQDFRHENRGFHPIAMLHD